MNIWAFTGNLGNDAVLRHTQSGDPVLSFNVAVKSGYGKNESTSWARCSKWGKGAEALSPYLVKGQLVGIVGELTHSKFTTKDGAEQWNLDVRVTDLTLLGKKDVAAQPETKPNAYDDPPF